MLASKDLGRVMFSRSKSILKNQSSFRQRPHSSAVWVVLSGLVVGWSWAEERSPEAALQAQSQSAKGTGNRLFTGHIQPLLQEHCLTCHKGDTKGGGLDLSTREALLKGGTRGPAIVPGDAKASLLYKLVTRQEEPGMPYKADKLPEEVISLTRG